MRLPASPDTDPGIDDAAAIVVAILASEFDLQLITTVMGNVSVEKATCDILQLLYFWNVEVPLAQGVAVPLVCAPCDAASVHGESGMANYDLIEHNRRPLGISVFLAIRDTLMRAPEPVTLVAIGSLTSIVSLSSQCPECKSYIRCLMIMGGSAGYGSCVPNAEFNIAADPEAAAYVFHSGIEIVMCGPDATDQAILTPGYLVTSPELNRTGKMLHVLLSYYRSGSVQSGLRMRDFYAIAWLACPSLFALKPCFAAIKTQGESTSGMTVVDTDGCLGKPVDVKVALNLDVEGFQRWVAKVLTLTS